MWFEDASVLLYKMRIKLCCAGKWLFLWPMQYLLVTHKSTDSGKLGPVTTEMKYFCSWTMCFLNEECVKGHKKQILFQRVMPLQTGNSKKQKKKLRPSCFQNSEFRVASEVLSHWENPGCALCFPTFLSRGKSQLISDFPQDEHKDNGAIWVSAAPSDGCLCAALNCGIF